MSEIISGLASSQVFQSAAVAFIIAQVGKMFTFRLTEGRWEPRLIVSSGGMPSSHAALVRRSRTANACAGVVCSSQNKIQTLTSCLGAQVSGLTMAIGLSQGFDDDLFCACFVFGCIGVGYKGYI